MTEASVYESRDCRGHSQFSNQTIPCMVHN
jgi:hypothetical protein